MSINAFQHGILRAGDSFGNLLLLPDREQQIRFDPNHQGIGFDFAQRIFYPAPPSANIVAVHGTTQGQIRKNIKTLPKF